MNKKKIKGQIKESLYEWHYKTEKLDDKLIMYEAFFGRGMLCNPYALFLRMIDDEAYAEYKHVWVIDDLTDNAGVIERWKDHPRVSFVKKRSTAYMKYLCRAGYLINNVTFPYYFLKKKGQIYVNTWHGIPMKALGYDMPNGNTETGNVIRNLLQADYIISANEFLTEKYLDAFKLRGLYTGKIVEQGYPRLDILEEKSRDRVLEKLARHNVNVDSKKEILLYAPTWRGETYDNADADVKHYFDFKAALEKKIDTDRYQILIKVHQRIYELAKDKLKEDFFVPAQIDADEILSVTDILISDFSSIYFDFLKTGRPVLFYIEDIEKYRSERGLYLGLDELPGPYTDSLDKLCGMIGDIESISKNYSTKYENIKSWSTFSDDGDISGRTLDIIFGKKNDYKQIENGSRHVLVLVSDTMSVPAELKKLFEKLKQEKGPGTDISVAVSKNIDEATKRCINEERDKEIRIFCIDSTYDIKRLDEKRQGREWNTTFGGARFERIIYYDTEAKEKSVLI